jgi:hypothetical protein
MLSYGLIVYLLAIIGLFAPIHSHQDSGTASSHSECQLCQISSEAFLSPVAMTYPGLVQNFVCLHEISIEPILNIRHQAFSSRGPPSA